MLDYTVKPDLGLLDPNSYFNEHNAPFNVKEHTHYVCDGGSHAYGTNTPSSDLDLRGVVLPPLNFLFGMNNFEQVENMNAVEGQEKKNDACFYSLKKLFILAQKNGPHALEMLHCDKKSIHYISPLMEKVLKHKNKFLSQQLHYSFAGYAFQQLMVMRTKTANGTGRVELIKKFSYDTKMAMHCLRLYRMGREVTLTGKLNVLRPDAEELLEVRNGKYSYDEFAKFEDRKNPETGKNKPTLVGGLAFEEELKFKEACNHSVLPVHPDFKFLDDLLVELQREHYLDK